MKGPHGSFVVSRPVKQDLVFIATGTGIAPVRGMLAEIFAPRVPLAHDVWLLFGVRISGGRGGWIWIRTAQKPF